MRVLLVKLSFAVIATLFLTGTVWAQGVIIPSPFVTSYDGWEGQFDGYFPPETEVHREPYQPQWGILLGHDMLSENSNGLIAGTSSGKFKGFNMVNMSTHDDPLSTYTLTATLNCEDNDGLGLLFGYQDENNYFRVSARSVGNGSGHPQGIAIQKAVNGVITQIGAPVQGSSYAYPIDDSSPFTLKVDVDGPNYTVYYNGTQTHSDSDADLAAGDYGVYSWALRGSDWGLQVEEVKLESSTVNQTHTFADTGAVSWKEHMMYNSYGVTMTHEHPSNFRLDFRDGTIRQNSDNATSATDATPNLDFLGPSVIVDDPNSSTWTDYEMRVRLTNEDNDGIGLLVRVQEDNYSFYRINFCNESMGTSDSRAPKGMSIQRCLYGDWTELYRDDQGSPLFTYTPKITGTDINDVIQEAVPFDVSVKVEGDEITVQVINDPEGAATVINYPTITDSSITSGTVGLTAWGSGAAEMESVFSGYGGNVNSPLLVDIGYQPNIPGDANHDGKVDGSDVTILADNWQAGVPGGNSGVTWEMGDFNGDHMVDGSDVTILADNWQFGVSTVAAAVPEPSMIVLFLLGIVTLFLRKWKR